jgi:hypothetical protein
MTPLLIASTRAAVRAGVAAPLSAALLVVGLATRWLGHGHDLDILRCLAFLLTAALISAVDDPAAETLAAVPYPLAARTLSRIAVTATAAGAIWLLGLAVADAAAPGTPLLGISLEGLGVAVFGVSSAIGIKRYGQIDEPAVLAVPAVLALLLATELIPRQWALVGQQTWGTPWVAEQFRWGCIVAIGAGLAARALTQSTGQRQHGCASTPSIGSADGSGRRFSWTDAILARTTAGTSPDPDDVRRRCRRERQLLIARTDGGDRRRGRGNPVLRTRSVDAL